MSTELIWAIVIAGWLACSVLTYGLSYAAFSGNWPESEVSSRRFTAMSSIFGPLSLIAWGIHLLDNPDMRGHGFRLW